MGNLLCCRRHSSTVINVVNNYHVIEAAAAAATHTEQDQPAPAVDVVNDLFEFLEDFDEPDDIVDAGAANYIVDSGATHDIGDSEHWSERLERIIRADAAVLGWRRLVGVVIRRNRGLQ